MKRTFPLTAIVAVAFIQAAPARAQAPAPERAPTARAVLGWRLGVTSYTFRNFTLFEAIDRARAIGLRNIEGFDGQKVSSAIPKLLNADLTDTERAALSRKLRSSGVAMPNWYHHRLATDEAGCRREFEFARSLGVETIVSEPGAEALPLIDKLAQEYGINVAIHNHTRDISPVYWDPKNVVSAIEGRSRRIGVCADVGFWTREGIEPLDALRLVKDRLLSLHLRDLAEAGPNAGEAPLGTGVVKLARILDEVYRLNLKPGLLSIESGASPDNPSPWVAQSAAFLERNLQRLVAERVDAMSRTTEIRRKLTPEDREKVEAAIPAKAPAKPLKPRKLLVVDMQVAYPGHRSIPHANLAIELMGKRTGAYEPAFSNDLANLRWEKLRQYDALYLNNTVGPIFNAPEIRESLLRFVREGGGLAGNHGATHASLDWPEFAELIGGKNGPHRDADEKVMVKLDDPASPINAAFAGKPFEFVDEYFRFPTAPYSRDRLHILISIDVARTDMNQGRACDACIRADNDYAISWIREYGKGRVFYCSLGHNPAAFWTPPLLEHFLAGIQYALGDLKADATPSARLARTLESMEPVLEKIAAFEPGQDRTALADFAGFVSDCYGSPERLRPIEQRLLRLLQSKATAAGKDFAFRQLSLIGAGASVPVLAGMLAQSETAEMARYALARIPGPAATAALRKALAGSSGRTRIGLINSLGQRRDALSVPALRGLLANPDARTAEAAAAALGEIADKPALDALAKARSTAPASLRPQLSEAYLQCAGRFAARGDEATAVGVYKQILAAEEPGALRIRALGGLAGAAGRDAVPALTAELESGSVKAQAAAIRLLNHLPGADITALLIRHYPKLGPTSQVRLLSALAERGDPSARPLIAEAVNSGSAQVRVAALDGLGKIGGPGDVTLLAGAAASGEGVEQAAARSSLYRMRGKDIDHAIVSAIGSTSGKVQAELIAAAGERAIAAAAGALLKAAYSEDAGVRRQALRALRNTGSASHAQAVLELVTKAADPAERREAARTLAAVLKNAPPGQTRAVVAAYQSSPALEVRTVLLEVLGQVPNDDTLPLLRNCLNDSDPEISRAAILALSSWNTPAPLPDLLAVAKNTPNSTLQVLALRGYITLVGLPSERTDPESVRLLAAAMELAVRPDEKRTVLSALPAYHCTESLELAKRFLNDPVLGKEAKTAVDRLQSALQSR